jgi:uncharacterized protein
VNFLKIVFFAAGVLVGIHAGLDAAELAPVFPAQTVPGSQIRVLPKSANGRSYQLYVALPDDYAAHPEKHYPVLYLCDGYWDFNLICGFKGNLIDDKTLPEIIVVGFGYPGENPDFVALREYDYTPVPDPKDPAAKKSGHAKEFLSALETEIIPYVEKEFRADAAYRVLGGYSFGGLFALYTLFERPTLFQAYVVPSPACIWAGNWIAQREAEFAARHKALPVRLFLTAAEKEWPDFRDSTVRFNEQLTSRNYEGFEYKFRLIDDEKHGGTKPESYNRGLRFAFAPLVPKE